MTTMRWLLKIGMMMMIMVMVVRNIMMMLTIFTTYVTYDQGLSEKSYRGKIVIIVMILTVKIMIQKFNGNRGTNNEDDNENHVNDVNYVLYK